MHRTSCGQWCRLPSAMDPQPESTLFKLPSTARVQKSDPPPVYLGMLLIVAGVVSVVTSIYISFTAKIFPSAGNPLVEMVRSDWYYWLLIPLTLPVTVVAVYLHWLSMKLFKHA